MQLFVVYLRRLIAITNQFRKMKQYNFLFLALLANAAENSAPFAMRASCNVCDDENPAPAFPAFATGLNAATAIQRGGVPFHFFLACDYVLPDYSEASMQAAINAGKLIILKDCAITGNKTTEATSTAVGSCIVDVVTNRTHTVTITDILDNATKDHAILWQHLQNNPKSYRHAFMTCDGVFYPFNTVQINPNLEIQDTEEGFSQWSVVITYRKLTNDLPQTITWTLEDLVYPAPIVP